MSGATILGADGRARCRWCAATPQYTAYHDREWGFPVADDRHLFEKLSLEGFQAGLSWRTILAKRERFREVFHRFEVGRIVRFTARDVERLLRDPGIVRHRSRSRRSSTTRTGRRSWLGARGRSRHSSGATSPMRPAVPLRPGPRPRRSRYRRI
jgi:hypothetical protein